MTALKDGIELMIAEIHSLRSEVEVLREKNITLMTALEFYSCASGNCDCTETKELHGEVSCGFVARSALDATA